ncbi:glutathione S-transferase [Mycena rebaudengoi]|nr:glutathione S-transferase [Mycena rebaudengoi]
MVLKLYGSPHGAGATAVVAMILTEKRVPFEFIPIDTMKELQHKAPEFLEKQPFGQVPAIDDDGFILYESRAICRYILEQYPTNGPQLIPTGVKSKALFEQAASVEFANFDPIVKKILLATFGYPAKGISADPAAATAAITELSSKLDVYEAILGKQKYLAGNELTLADLFHLGYGSILAYGKCDIMTSKGPNVTRWWNELLSMQSWVGLQGGIKSTA